MTHPRELQKKGYKWLEQKVTYAGIKQRWLIVESAELKQSYLIEKKKIENQIQENILQQEQLHRKPILGKPK